MSLRKAEGCDALAKKDKDDRHHELAYRGFQKSADQKGKRVRPGMANKTGRSTESVGPNLREGSIDLDLNDAGRLMFAGAFASSDFNADEDLRKHGEEVINEHRALSANHNQPIHITSEIVRAVMQKRDSGDVRSLLEISAEVNAMAGQRVPDNVGSIVMPVRSDVEGGRSQMNTSDKQDPARLPILNDPIGTLSAGTCRKCDAMKATKDKAGEIITAFGEVFGKPDKWLDAISVSDEDERVEVSANRLEEYASRLAAKFANDLQSN